MAFAQNPPLDSIVRDGEGNPLYFRNQMIETNLTAEFIRIVQS